ncbi:uncharacterized protein LOC129614119 [Condylostylus longicornis]|uniref:uncharacterized protein LOC129614119 n=1 Tax=Condylostylus longicornis TaxID=2530218 RepID=UPI00244E576B|nr:uncharacterized protein LOC129614119 [Condylostylus longicornis]XP_055384491.1 uncharacterized protein LOC129614119 [Condylostylus longicornis]XP_055384492.1 uncharacterized protein LOC129614119 [Condylostylus longicornis]
MKFPNKASAENFTSIIKTVLPKELPEALPNTCKSECPLNANNFIENSQICSVGFNFLNLSLSKQKPKMELSDHQKGNNLEQTEIISISSRESEEKTPIKTEKIKKLRNVTTKVKKEKAEGGKSRKTSQSINESSVKTPKIRKSILKTKSPLKRRSKNSNDESDFVGEERIIGNSSKNYKVEIKEEKTKSQSRKKKLEILNEISVETPKTKKTKVKAKSTIKKNFSNNSDDDSDFDTEKKPIIRRLTRSTNLKKISYKNHPPSQTRIEKYFTITPKNNTISYFKTFDKSKVRESKTEPCTIENVNSYLDYYLQEIKIENNLEGTNLNLDKFNKEQADTEDKNFNFANAVKEERNDCDVNLVSSMNAALIARNVEGASTKSLSSAHIQNLRNQIQCNMSSESFALSETARIHKSSSFQKSSESKITMENEEIQPTKSKRARKRLSFKNSGPTNQMEQKLSELDSLLSFPVSERSLKTNSTKTENSCKENFRSENCTINISDEDSEPILKQKETTNINIKGRKTKSNHKTQKSVECPFYKVVSGTTFAVDAFRFGYIEGITHYFLSHYHGDHYIGLKKAFSMPIYMSSITARLVEGFIHVNPEYINVIDPNESININGIEITAIDANHCPGAVMFAFKFQNGNVTLHTGDFRASFEMESNPYFWNNEVQTIYLDTTYLNNNYDFKPQFESIEDVRNCVKKFEEKHIGKRILYICGSYVIGKEKVWAAIAEMTGQSVYTSGNRLKALRCIADPELVKYIGNDPKTAGIHVLSVGELFYDKLFKYYKTYEEYFDLVLAIRPSGWERNSKPQYRGKINIVGIEYSEHSSYSELRRFIRFLQPRSIISTVPNGSDISKTCPIPINWFDNRLKPKLIAYQPSITNFASSRKKYNKKRLKSEEATCSKYLEDSRYDLFVSPIKTETIISSKSKIS